MCRRSGYTKTSMGFRVNAIPGWQAPFRPWQRCRPCGGASGSRTKCRTAVAALAAEYDATGLFCRGASDIRLFLRILTLQQLSFLGLLTVSHVSISVCANVSTCKYESYIVGCANIYLHVYAHSFNRTWHGQPSGKRSSARRVLHWTELATGSETRGFAMAPRLQ